MNKKILILLIVLTASVGVIFGCSKVTGQEGSETSENIMQSEVMEDVSELIGKVDEINDFMFIVTDEDNVSYAFTFDEKPEGLDKIAVGDRVLVNYTGTISEVDPFMGKIMKIKLYSGSSEILEENSSDKNQGGDIRSSGITDPYVNPEVTFSNLTSEEDRKELGKDLEEVGIKESYIKDFINYVNIYNETAPKSVLNGWNTLDKVNYDPYEIADVWVQEYPDFVGVCCRMASFTLLRDDILVNNTDFEKTSMGALAFDNYSFEIGRAHV